MDDSWFSRLELEKPEGPLLKSQANGSAT
jgi:hypothetical protein